MNKVFFLLCMCALSLNLFARRHNNNCFQLELFKLVDSLKGQLDNNKSVLFSMEFLNIVNDDNYTYRLSIAHSLDDLIMIDTSYYLVYKGAFIVVNNFSKQDLKENRIEDILSGAEVLTQQDIDKINLVLDDTTHKKIPDFIDKYYYVESVNGKVTYKIQQAWIRD